ncbi:MAG: peptidoglycan DD-metalloendopeptidase family protein [Candidatus Uhrbacteria bacterium]|nr:peptidoglycan DD-metalloendopeptidase family protein [Candidatus Uhrbacteria bacterium]
MSHVRTPIFVSTIGIMILFFCVHISFSHADEPVPIVSPDVQQAIQDKKSNIDQLNDQIQAYQKKINEAQSQSLSLETELDILQNRLKQAELQINETTAQIELIQAEISKTEQDILAMQKKLDHQKELITGVVQKIQAQDQSLPIQLFYGSDRFSALLDTVQKLEQINSDLSQSVAEAKAVKVSLEQAKEQQEKMRDEHIAAEQELETQKMQFNEQLEAKQIILTNTHQSEKKFQKLVQDLKEEQVTVQNQIQDLQSRLEQRIQPSDKIGGGLLSWPIDPKVRGISATFHDPTYPFRNLFEHPGIDLPAPTGTPVHAAASGFVAWTRRGVQYGNYVMVIHSDGIATLYAHLSRIDVIADQYVPRGGQIGLVGMTGLATGPHLHFEVRKEGIPTDPMPYLQSP